MSDNHFHWSTLFLYPELRHFNSADVDAEAVYAASASPWRSRRYWMGFAIIASKYLAKLSLPIALLLAIPIGFWAVILELGLFRRPMRRTLRLGLKNEGLPICVPCGYSLAGIQSDRCPECGAPITSLGNGAFYD